MKSIFIFKGRWRCSNTLVTDWEKPTFNDKSWPKATAVTHSYTGASNIDSSAKWIWGAQPTKAYCRAFLCKLVMIKSPLECKPTNLSHALISHE